jgi:FlaG/FlaF family flagellin (archaellin)
MKSKMKKSKKGLSEMVSYVLLIMIALGIAAAVFVWIAYYVPSINEREKCPEGVSLFIKQYSCDNTSKVLNLTVQNKGLFNIDGFFVRASNDTTKKPIAALSSEYAGMESIFPKGQYDISFTHYFFPPEGNLEATFSYTNLNVLKRIQLQPYVYSETQVKKTMVLCPNPTEIEVDNCN